MLFISVRFHNNKIKIAILLLSDLIICFFSLFHSLDKCLSIMFLFSKISFKFYYFCCFSILYFLGVFSNLVSHPFSFLLSSSLPSSLSLVFLPLWYLQVEGWITGLKSTFMGQLSLCALLIYVTNILVCGL